MAADGSMVAVQFAATTEVVTGRRLVLFVALSSSRWGPRFRRMLTPEQRLGNQMGTRAGAELGHRVARMYAHGVVCDS